MLTFYYNIKIPQSVFNTLAVEKVMQEAKLMSSEFDKQFEINQAVRQELSNYLIKNKLYFSVNDNFINHDKATLIDNTCSSLQEAYNCSSNLLLLTAHSGNTDIIEQVTLKMLAKHFTL